MSVRNRLVFCTAGRVSSAVSAKQLRSLSTASPKLPVDDNVRHLLKISDLSSHEFQYIVGRGLAIKKDYKSQTVPKSAGGIDGRTVSLLFSKRSTRTRISSEGAVAYLGGHPMFLGKEDIQLGVNESLYDSGRVISSMTSAIVARVGPHSDIARLAEASSVPVINALCELYHPLQAIADIMTVVEAFKTTKGLNLAWVGDSNNVINDLMTAAAKMGINVNIATPANHPINQDILELARLAGDENGSGIQVLNDPVAAVEKADIIVTDTWISMGHEAEKQKRIKEFEGFKVTSELAAKGKANPDWKFMHCLPRKQDEVSDEVFYDEKRSLVFQEAENRLYAAIAALEVFVVNKGKFHKL